MKNINKLIMESYHSSIILENLELYRAGRLGGPITWMSTDKELSDEYGAENDIPVKKYNIDISKPFPVRKSEQETSMKDFILSIVNYMDGEGVEFTDDDINFIKDLLKIKMNNVKVFEVWDKYPNEIKRLLKIGGYDSIKTTEGGKVTYGVFNTNLKEENSNDISSIEDKWREKGLSVYVYDRGDYWYLAELIVPKDEQKQGLGSSFMNDLIELADSKGKRITLTPAMKDKKHGTTSRTRLQKFYKKFGFVTNTGRNKDFTVNADQMYREPKSINEVTISK